MVGLCLSQSGNLSSEEGARGRGGHAGQEGADGDSRHWAAPTPKRAPKTRLLVLSCDFPVMESVPVGTEVV